MPRRSTTTRRAFPVRLCALLTVAVLLALAALAATRTVGTVMVVRDGRMLPALWPGDRLLIVRERDPPSRGTLVRYDDHGVPRLARIIAVPGERVAIRAGRVVIDGRSLVRFRVADRILPPSLPCPIPRDGEDCRLRRVREMLPDGTFVDTIRAPAGLAAHTLTAGERFLLTDDRDAPQPGIVSIARIRGRASRILFSLDRTPRWSRPADWRDALRRDRTLRGVEPAPALR